MNAQAEPATAADIAVHDEIAALVARSRAAQRIIDGWDQARVDELATAAAWAIVEPARNRALAECAVRDTGLGNVDDKIAKNRRKTMGLLRDLAGARTVGVIAEDRARGLIEIARPVGVVAADHPVDQSGRDPGQQHRQRAQVPQRHRAGTLAQGYLDTDAAVAVRVRANSIASAPRTTSSSRCRRRARASTRAN